ncbi:MAG: YcxB family protein [Pseudomonadales bacterium]|nr:YcxB family protein [Pseudomonadales bacterium]
MNFTDQPEIAGWMLIALGVLEVLHIRYRRAWWLARQMWGASANSEVTLTINDEGIRTQSSFVQTSLLWIDIVRVIETNLGHLLVDKAGGQQYLSKSLLPADLMDEMVALHQS